VGVTASDPDVRVAEHLLDDREGDPLIERDGRRAVPHGMHAMVRQAGRREDIRPLLPVSPGVDRPPVRLAEHEVVILPEVRRQEHLLVLGVAMILEQCHQFGGQPDRLAPPLLDLAEDQPSARAARALRGVALAAGRADALVAGGMHTWRRPDLRAAFGHRFGQASRCQLRVQAATSEQPCRQGSRWSWYQTFIAPSSRSRYDQRSPSASPWRRPHARPTDQREAFRRSPATPRTARACVVADSEAAG
jgi:hypothetical protein